MNLSIHWPNTWWWVLWILWNAISNYLIFFRHTIHWFDWLSLNEPCYSSDLITSIRTHYGSVSYQFNNVNYIWNGAPSWYALIRARLQQKLIIKIVISWFGWNIELNNRDIDIISKWRFNELLLKREKTNGPMYRVEIKRGFLWGRMHTIWWIVWNYLLWLNNMLENWKYVTKV